MAKKVIWTEPAKEDLKAIYDFNTIILGEQKAFEIVEHLVGFGKLLEKDFLAASRHISTINPDLKYQRFIWKHYLIIFRESENTVYVNRVFDSRQNPKKVNL